MITDDERELKEAVRRLTAVGDERARHQRRAAEWLRKYGLVVQPEMITFTPGAAGTCTITAETARWRSRRWLQSFDLSAEEVALIEGTEEIV